MVPGFGILLGRCPRWRRDLRSGRRDPTAFGRRALAVDRRAGARASAIGARAEWTWRLWIGVHFPLLAERRYFGPSRELPRGFVVRSDDLRAGRVVDTGCERAVGGWWGGGTRREAGVGRRGNNRFAWGEPTVWTSVEGERGWEWGEGGAGANFWGWGAEFWRGGAASWAEVLRVETYSQSIGLPHPSLGCDP